MNIPNCEYDIFSGTENKNPLWIGCVTGYEAARARVQALSAEKPDSYFVFCTITNRVVYAITATESVEVC
jgi:hypothetical protein